MRGHGVRVSGISGYVAQFGGAAGFDIVLDDDELWVYDAHLQLAKQIPLGVVDSAELFDRDGSTIKAWSRLGGWVW